MDKPADNYEHHVNSVSVEKITNYLEKQENPVYESQLLKQAFPGIDIIGSDALSLFQNHFVLYNILYRLQSNYAEERLYLYIHFMRTCLIPYPDVGECRHFNEQTLTFCKSQAQPGGDICAFHMEKIGAGSIDQLSIRWFYMDKSNYDRLDIQTAEAFISGSFKLLSDYKAIKESFTVLDLPENSSINSIKKRFKFLAKMYHPDRGAATHEQFARINSAYQILLRSLTAGGRFLKQQ